MSEVVTLVTIGDGAALELFQAELEKVLRNIADPNTEADKVRKITLEVKFTPSKARDTGDVEIRCTSKLPGLKDHATFVYFGRHQGELVAMEHNPKQAGLFDEGTGIQPMAIEGGKR